MAGGPGLPPVDGRYAAMRLIEVLYATITADDILAAAEATGRFAGRVGASGERSRRFFAKARGGTACAPSSSLTDVVDGRRVIRDDPPVVTHVELRRRMAPWSRSSSTTARRWPRVGASSWSATGSSTSRSRSSASAASAPAASSSSSRAATRTTRSSSRPRRRPLGARAAPRSEPTTPTRANGSSSASGSPRRTSDVFLGWTRGPGGRDFYVRQLWDMKGSVDTAMLQARASASMAASVRLGAGTRPRSDRRRGGDLGVSRHQRHVRWGDRRLRRDVRRRQNERDHGPTWPRIADGRVSTPSA